MPQTLLVHVYMLETLRELWHEPCRVHDDRVCTHGNNIGILQLACLPAMLIVEQSECRIF